MPRNPPPVNPVVLEWALDESGLSVDEVADRVGVPSDVITSWIVGKTGPSQGQFTQLARILRRPPSIFFLPEAPAMAQIPPRLRRAAGSTERQLSADELREVRRARRLQRLIRLLIQDADVRPVQIPPLATGARPGEAGATLRTWLRVKLGEQEAWPSARVAFDGWRAALEDRGVLVMQLKLGGEGLRGFSLADETAPLIAVNTAENLQARIFTLLHELAHLASETDTACLAAVGAPIHDGSIEKWCDSVASAAILPRGALTAALGELVPAGEPATVAAVETIASRFHASLRATAVALIRSELAPDELYEDVEEAFPTGDYEKGFARGRAPRAPQRRLAEVGPRTAGIVAEALSANRLSEREARQYLRLDGTELSDLMSALAETA